MIFDLLKTLFEAGRSLYGDRRNVRLTVHRGTFQSTGRECYFINAANLSRNREIEITHVWFATTPQVAALQEQRPLPRRLKPDEAWETWVEVGQLPHQIGDQVYTLARARLSTGAVIQSRRNESVPEQGTVPGSTA